MEKRLEQIVESAGFDAALNVFGTVGGGLHDGRYHLVMVVVFQLQQQADAVQLRHMVVEYIGAEIIGGVLVDPLARFDAVARGFHLIVGRFEIGAEQCQTGRVVVNQ